MSYIYENGNEVQTGSHGDTDYVFASGEPVSNTGISDFVYESGTGLGGVPADTVYVATRYDPTMYALNKSDGSEKWSYKVNGYIYSSPYVKDGVVYFGNDAGNIYALNANDGTEKWVCTIPTGEVNSSPTVNDGVLFVGSQDTNLYAVNTSDGSEKWSTYLDNNPDASPVVNAGSVYVSTYQRVYKLSESDGTIEWKSAQRNMRNSSPELAGGSVYTRYGNEIFAALDASDGTKQWEFATGYDEEIFGAAQVVDGTVYITVDFIDPGEVYALDADSGTKQWEFTGASGDYQGSPAVINGTLYTGDGDGVVYALDASGGTKQWEFTGATGDYGNMPAVVDGTVYIGDEDGNVFALNASNGTKKWSVSLGSLIDTSPAVGEIWSYPERRRI